MPGVRPRRVLVVGCGALGRELATLTRGLPGIDVTCLPAELHNRPERIPAAVEGRIRARGGDYDRVFVAYADCGTGGRLDALLESEFEGVERIAGAHCYEFYAGSAAFGALQEEEPGTFYLTDFLARQFETIVIRGLGLDRHPELRDAYFGNYRRLVYLAQTGDPELVARARAAADRLGLGFEVRRTGLGDLAPVIQRAAAPDSGVSVISGASEAVRTGAGHLPGAVPPGPESSARARARRGAARSAQRRMARAVPNLPVTPESAPPSRPAGTG